MNSNSLSISIIMPAYNEEHSIVSAVDENKESFSSLGLDFEIIIVNDASTDGTAEIADQLAKQNKNISCYHHHSNLGPGGAFKTGVLYSKKEYIIFIPFDNPLSVDDLKTYLPMVEVCDIVVGVRTERMGYNRFERFASFFYNRILVPLLFNIGVSDVNWIQLYRRKFFEDGTLNVKNTKIFFLVEILVLAKKNRLIIAEVPSKMKRRLYRTPTCTRFSTMWETFWDAIRFFLKMRKNKEE